VSTRELTASTPVPTAVLPGVVAGASTALSAMAVYQVVRLSFWAAGRLTVHAGQTAPTGLDGWPRFIGQELLPSLISLGPALLAGAIVGGLVGLAITQTWDRQGPLRAALTGALVTFVIAFIINTTVLSRRRREPLSYERWSHLIGYPSVLFVLLFAGVGAWLYVNRARQAAAPTTFDLRER
jgi:branched-subunit amino acid ABC-type transport system permease component